MSLAHDLHKALGLPDNVTRFSINVNFEEDSTPKVIVEYECSLNRVDECGHLVRRVMSAELVNVHS